MSSAARASPTVTSTSSVRMSRQQSIDPLPRRQCKNVRGQPPRHHQRVPSPRPAPRHHDLLRLPPTRRNQQPNDLTRHARRVSGASITWSGGAGLRGFRQPDLDRIPHLGRALLRRDHARTRPSSGHGDRRPLLGSPRRARRPPRGPPHPPAAPSPRGAIKRLSRESAAASWAAPSARCVPPPPRSR